MSLSLTSSDNADALELVAGDRRMAFDDHAVGTFTAARSHPVWGTLLAADRLSMTQDTGKGFRTSRFDGFDLAAIADQMHRRCNFAKDAEADAASAFTLTPDGWRLLNLAAYHVLGDPRGPSDVPDVQTGPARARLSNALAKLGEAATENATAETAATLLATIGVLLPPEFEAISSVGDGRIAALKGGKWGVFEPGGDWVVQPRHSGAVLLPDGYVTLRLGGGWAVLDETGARTAMPLADAAPLCRDGVCRIQRGERVQYHAIDRGASLTGGHAQGTEFRDGFAAVTDDGAGWVVIDRSGKVVAGPVDVHRMSAPADGVVALQSVRGGTWRFAALNDLEPYGLSFDALDDTGGFLVPARQGKLWGYASRRSGGWAIEPRFAEVRGVAFGLAPVTEDGLRWSVLDRRGRSVLPPRFAGVGVFSERFATVRASQSGLVGLMDVDGRLVVPPVFDEIGPFRDGLAAFRFGSLWGVLSRDLVSSLAGR